MNTEVLYIDGVEVPIENEANLLQVIRKADIELPTFCYHSELSVYGACRLCVVDIEGRGIQTSCSIKPEPGMKIKISTEELRRIRKVNLELILANHDVSCPTCSRSNNCKLQELAYRIGISKSRFKKTNIQVPIDDKSHSIIHDPNKCVLCGDCVRVCKEIQTVGAIDFSGRGAKTKVSPAFGMDLSQVECVYCGQCVAACPVGALTPKPETEQAWKAINNPQKVVVAQIAPAVRVAIGEIFGFEPGTVQIGQIVAAMKKLGFDYVYDTSFAADLTVIEEAEEFIKRKLNNEKLPQFTSCCPSWVKFVEQYYADLIPNLSTCKSPQQMFGSLAKEMLPEILGVAKENLVVVSVMPCTAKKFEAKRDEFYTDGAPDVDIVLSTEGLGKMIKEKGILFNKLTPQSLDLPLGFKSGAGVIFGNSGGVSEAVLRYAYERVTGEKLRNADFHIVRGKDGLREATVQLGKITLNLAVVHSLKNARKICEEATSGQSKYDFIEVMSCPGGCVNGGGQPVNFEPDYIEKRTAGIFNADKMVQVHKPQENPYVKEVYEKILGEPGSHKAHELLHTHYHGRKRIQDQEIVVRNSNLSKVTIKVCVGSNCFIRGAQDLLKKLMFYVAENKLTEFVGFEGQQEMVDVKATFCFEKCDRGPVVQINNKLIEHATFEIVKEELWKKLEKHKVLV
jgi:NADH-quinone oxidoreductase subunit G